RCSVARCAKKHDIANLLYRAEGSCAVAGPRNSTPLNSEMLGISRPVRVGPPNCVAQRAPQKSNQAATFVGAPRPQRARRQNSLFFERRNRESVPQIWKFR